MCHFYQGTYTVYQESVPRLLHQYNQPTQLTAGRIYHKCLNSFWTRPPTTILAILWPLSVWCFFYSIYTVVSVKSWRRCKFWDARASMNFLTPSACLHVLNLFFLHKTHYCDCLFQQWGVVFERPTLAFGFLDISTESFRF